MTPTATPWTHVFHNAQRHWVGDGFPVRTVFSYGNAGRVLSPFLMLDHAGPTTFNPTTAQRGVGEHPHRGFETVTIVFDGEVTHQDSAGGGGTIGPGEVQWMTAGAGVVYAEFHSRAYAQRGGAFEMIQLWVNLPAKLKMTAPSNKALTRDSIRQGRLDCQPTLDSSPDLAPTAQLNVYAGTLAGFKGPALTHSPIVLASLRIPADSLLTLPKPTGHVQAALLMRGQLHAENTLPVETGDVLVWPENADQITLHTTQDTLLLWLGGEPILEPIAGYGPFVMNTQAEIHQAVLDFRAGRMGQLTPTSL